MKASPEVNQEAVPASGIHIGKECVTGGVGDCKQESVHSRDCGGREEAEPGEELGGGGGWLWIAQGPVTCGGAVGAGDRKAAGMVRWKRAELRHD